MAQAPARHRPPIVATRKDGEKITFQTLIRGNGHNNILGRGGEGVVYRGTTSMPGRAANVAVKAVRIPVDKESGAYTSLITRIANSITASYLLSIRGRCNPRIVCLYAVIVHPDIYPVIAIKPNPAQKAAYIYTSDAIDPNLCYMLYELVDGQDLEKILRLTPADEEINYVKYGTQLLEAVNLLHSPPPPAAVAAAATAAAAAAQADPADATKAAAAAAAAQQVTHARKLLSLVHLDIKTANAMIGTDDNLRIIDMGTACAVNERSCARAAMSFPYSGPEAHPLAERSKARLVYSDVFATGITLYEMIMRPRDEEGRPTHAIPLEEDSYPAYNAFWRAKAAEAAPAEAPAEAAAAGVVPGELNLHYPPEKEFLKPLINVMIKRDFRERPTIAQSMTIWNEIFSRNPTPTVAEVQEIVNAIYVPEPPAPQAAAAAAAAGPAAAVDPAGCHAEGGRRTRKRRKNHKTRKSRKYR